MKKAYPFRSDRYCLLMCNRNDHLLFLEQPALFASVSTKMLHLFLLGLETLLDNVYGTIVDAVQ